MVNDASVNLPADTKEGVGEIQDFFTIDATDEELVRMIDRKIQSVGKPYEDFKKEGKINETYWQRDQLKGISLRWHNSRIIQNRIYMSVETMVPIITSKPAEPVISIADDEEEDSEISKKFTDKLQKMVLDKYYDQDYPQQELMEIEARHLLLYKLGVPKIIWDEGMDDYLVEYVHPHKLIVSSEGHYNQDVWVAQYLEKTLEEICEMFPEKEEDILNKLFPGMKVDKKEYGSTPIGFWEYWPEDGKYVVWKMQDVILQKKLNPYIKWTNDKEFDTEANHFDYSHKPYMFLNSQNLGKHIWDDTSPVTQGLSIQDGINMMQRIITDTARDQGILVGAQEFIDRDELYKYTGAPDDKLSVQGGDAARALYRVPPKNLAPHVQENLLHLENALDNIMGTHATTRGERSGQPTASQDLLTKESDYGRIDAVVRGIERMSSEIYNWEIQMMVAKYEEKHYQRVLGNKKGSELYNEMKEYNKRGIKIVVKPGSTLPTDKVSQRTEALELARMNKISDIDLFERMDFPNPTEMAKNLYLQNSNPAALFPDLAPPPQTPGEVPPGEFPPVEGQLPPPMGGEIPPIEPMGQVPPMEQPPVEALPPQPLFSETLPLTEEVTAPIDVNPEVANPPLQPELPPEELPQQGTEHTAALLQGAQVPPFEGIDPAAFEEHVVQEFNFLASEEFVTLEEEIQKNYARHVLAEREIVKNAAPQDL